jgi:hypothetical protein
MYLERNATGNATERYDRCDFFMMRSLGVNEKVRTEVLCAGEQ